MGGLEAFDILLDKMQVHSTQKASHCLALMKPHAAIHQASHRNAYLTLQPMECRWQAHEPHSSPNMETRVVQEVGDPSLRRDLIDGEATCLAFHRQTR